MNVHAYVDPIRQRMVVSVDAGDGPAPPDWPSGPGRWWMKPESEGGGITWVENGAEIPVYLSLDLRMAEAIGEVLAPRPEASARHLDDALDVRDRMIGMVERIVDSDLAREAGHAIPARRS